MRFTVAFQQEKKEKIQNANTLINALLFFQKGKNDRTNLVRVFHSHLHFTVNFVCLRENAGI